MGGGSGAAGTGTVIIKGGGGIGGCENCDGSAIKGGIGGIGGSFVGEPFLGDDVINFLTVISVA